MGRRFATIAFLLLALAACAAVTSWMPLARARLNPRMSWASNPPTEMAWPTWVEAARGYASGGETGLTAVAWMRYRRTDDMSGAIIAPFVAGMCTAEACRATRDGGAALTNLVTGTLDDEEIDVSAGTWARECLPSGYAVPEGVTGWDNGCYCINVTANAPLTLEVAGTAVQLPATNGFVRNVMGSSASRWVRVETTPGARVTLGVAEMPLHQFVQAQSDTQGGDAYMSSDPAHGGLTETWRMAAMRARIESGRMIVRMDMYTPAGRCDAAQCITQALWRARATFEKDAMVRMCCSAFAPGHVAVTAGMRKLFGGWLDDAALARVRDLDVAELERHGASFPELAPDFRELRVAMASASSTETRRTSAETNGQEYACREVRYVTSRAADVEVVHGVNYAGPFSPADYAITCAGATVEGTRVTFPADGTYVVRATDPAGGSLTNAVTASGPAEYTRTEIEYVRDGGRAAEFNAAVAGALARATNDGVEYAYVAGAVTNRYWKWRARRLWPCPSASPSARGNVALHAISPHVLASARHWGWWPRAALTFTDAAGNSATVTPGEPVRPDEWARGHGFTEEEIAAADLGDLVLFVTDAAIPDGCCPWLMSEETWAQAVPGPFGVLGWRATQTDLGWGLPVLISPDISRAGNGMSARWRWSRDFPFPTAGLSWAAASGLMAGSLAFGAAAPSLFAPTYAGDSGLPVFLEDAQGRLVCVANHRSAASGTSYTRAFAVLKAFCASQGDTLKEW